jgi:membrane protein DedA with SNARE-associated domain/rhodanese-related sulfurtransferase
MDIRERVRLLRLKAGLRMALPVQFLIHYGYLLLFVWVLTEQLGVPLPAAPVLLAAGSLSAEHEISFILALLAGVGAALSADSTWFLIGSRYGHYVMRLLCTLSLEPAVCVRRTRELFERRRNVALLFAKFVPGLGILASPVAGQNGMRFGQFLFFDALGSARWVGALLAAGRLFGVLLLHNPSLLNWAGKFSGALLALGVLGLLMARIVRRRRMIGALVAARLEPEELKRKLDAGEEMFIADLRHPSELLTDPFTLPGALHFSPSSLAARNHEIPRDRDIVLYCSCPSEATAANTAMSLHKLGIERVRPLRGGYDEWKRLGFPLVEARPDEL